MYKVKDREDGCFGRECLYKDFCCCHCGVELIIHHICIISPFLILLISAYRHGIERCLCNRTQDAMNLLRWHNILRGKDCIFFLVKRCIIQKVHTMESYAFTIQPIDLLNQRLTHNPYMCTDQLISALRILTPFF